MSIIIRLGLSLLLLLCAGLTAMQAWFAMQGALSAGFEPQFAYTMAASVVLAEVCKLAFGHMMLGRASGHRWRWVWLYVACASYTVMFLLLGNLQKEWAAARDAAAIVEQYREQEAKRAGLRAEVDKLELQIGAGGRAWDVVDAEYRRIANTRITCNAKYRDTLCDQLDRLAEEAKTARVVWDAKANRDKLNAQLAAMPPFDPEKDLHMRRIEPNRTSSDGSSDWSSAVFRPNRIGSVALEVLIVCALYLILLGFRWIDKEKGCTSTDVNSQVVNILPNATRPAPNQPNRTNRTSSATRPNVRTWVLSEIQRDGGLVGSQIQLAARAGCSKSSISEALGVLEAEGKIRREVVGRDVRWVLSVAVQPAQPAQLKVVK